MMNRNVLHLTCPPIPVLRIGFVGLGNRGILALERYMHLEGVEVKALCDLRPRNIERATALLHRFNRPAATRKMQLSGYIVTTTLPLPV